MTHAELARRLGGSCSGGWINVPGPGHKKADRSLGIFLDPSALDGFWVHSLAGDDPALCRKHVLSLLAKIASGGAIEIEMEETSAKDAERRKRIASALLIWQEALP
jgi:hypothetical protein